MSESEYAGIGLNALDQLLESCLLKLNHDSARAAGVLANHSAGVLKRVMADHLANEKMFIRGIAARFLFTIHLFGGNEILPRKAGGFMAFCANILERRSAINGPAASRNAAFQLKRNYFFAESTIQRWLIERSK